MMNYNALGSTCVHWRASNRFDTLRPRYAVLGDARIVSNLGIAAAILAADFVGYSRLVAADEAITLALFKTHRKW